MQEIRFDGSKGDIKPFDPEALKESLDKPEVKEVRVFKLREGMKLNIDDNYFIVEHINHLGEATLKPIPKPKRPSHSVRGSIEEEE